MKVGSTGLRMSSGEIRHFRSSQARDNFERVASAYRHGWSPTHKKLRSAKKSYYRKRGIKSV